MDKLDKIFEMQKALNERILGPNFEKAYEEETAKWVLNYCRALQQEVSELVDCVPWKWWAHYQHLDKEHAKEELVDVIHFVVSLAQTLGMSPDDIFTAYLEKNAINHQRQDSGYTHKDSHNS